MFCGLKDMRKNKRIKLNFRYLLEIDAYLLDFQHFLNSFDCILRRILRKICKKKKIFVSKLFHQHLNKYDKRPLNQNTQI